MDLVECLGVGALAGVEFLFCNAGGTVGMASTVLVVGPLGAAGGISASTGACWMVSGGVELEFCSLAAGLGLRKLLFLLRMDPLGVSTM